MKKVFSLLVIIIIAFIILLVSIVGCQIKSEYLENNNVIIEKEAVTYEYDQDSILKSNSAIDQNGNQYRMDLKFENRKGEAIICENGNKTLGITLHFLKNKPKLKSKIKYFPDETYEIIVDIEDPDTSVPFSATKKYRLKYELFGNQIDTLVSPAEINLGFVNVIENIVKESGKSTIELKFLDPVFLNLPIQYTIKEANLMLSPSPLKVLPEAAMDIFGTGLSDIGGWLLTAVYGLVSYLFVEIMMQEP